MDNSAMEQTPCYLLILWEIFALFLVYWSDFIFGFNPEKYLLICMGWIIRVGLYVSYRCLSLSSIWSRAMEADRGLGSRQHTVQITDSSKKRCCLLEFGKQFPCFSPHSSPVMLQISKRVWVCCSYLSFVIQWSRHTLASVDFRSFR